MTQTRTIARDGDLALQGRVVQGTPKQLPHHKPMTLEKIWVGIDVCKASLDVHLLPQGSTFQLSNSAAGVQELIARFEATVPHLVVVESTGGLERTLVAELQRAAISAAVANPRKVKGFAIALGKAKTDKLDAEVIARFAQSVNLQAQGPWMQWPDSEVS